MAPDEVYLLEGLREGDPVVFRTLYKLYWEKLYNMVFYYVRNEADAEDILQDVFISLWSRHKHIQIEVALENYLVRSAKYTTFFYLKLRQKQQTSLRNVPKPARSMNNIAEEMDYKSLLEKLDEILDSVSQKTKEIFYLSRFNGFTYKEIAGQLRISVKTVEYHISVALKRLTMEEW